MWFARSPALAREASALDYLDPGPIANSELRVSLGRMNPEALHRLAEQLTAAFEPMRASFAALGEALAESFEGLHAAAVTLDAARRRQSTSTSRSAVRDTPGRR